MTKLNYDRPILRYLDNLRRELRTAPAGAVPGDYGGVPITVITGSGMPRKAPMPRLNDVESGIAYTMVEALGAYIESDLAVFETMPTFKGKGKGNTAKAIAARNVTEKALVYACVRFLLQGLQSKQQGRDQVLKWYAWLGKAFEEIGEAGPCSAWDTLNNFAMKAASEQLEEIMEKVLAEQPDEATAGKP